MILVDEFGIRIMSDKEILKAAKEREETEQKDTKSIVGIFAEALGCLEDALHWLGQVNEQYDSEQHSGARRWQLVDDMRPVICNPNMDFWLQTEFAEDKLKDILNRLRRVVSLAPKEIT